MLSSELILTTMLLSLRIRKFQLRSSPATLDTKLHLLSCPKVMFRLTLTRLISRLESPFPQGPWKMVSWCPKLNLLMSSVKLIEMTSRSTSSATYSLISPPCSKSLSRDQLPKVLSKPLRELLQLLCQLLLTKSSVHLMESLIGTHYCLNGWLTGKLLRLLRSQTYGSVAVSKVFSSKSG